MFYNYPSEENEKQMLVNNHHYRTVWFENKQVKMINQPLLPHRFEVFNSDHHLKTAMAIKNMIVRGAGAIGSTAGYALAQAALEAPVSSFLPYLKEAYATIAGTRPTAQNLFYALKRVMAAIEKEAAEPAAARQAAILEAEAIAAEDVAACSEIGRIGSGLLKDGDKVLTHCNAGWLAFTDWGSALAPVYHAKRTGKQVFVWVDETRPRCQGARLTAWELAGEQIDFAVIADNAAGFFMYRQEVNLVITGSDRIAANGDVANKIGTYEKAVIACENKIPFYVAAPLATIDWQCASGREIPIEERDQEEVTAVMGRDSKGEVSRVTITPQHTTARNPAFDVTPARYITGIITEKGIVKPQDLGQLRE